MPDLCGGKNHDTKAKERGRRSQQQIHAKASPTGKVSKKVSPVRSLRLSLSPSLSGCVCVSLQPSLSLPVSLQVYPDPVRVVSVALAVCELLDDQTDRQTSVELCCGT